MVHYQSLEADFTAADRYIRRENRIASTSLHNFASGRDFITNDINEVVSELGNAASDQLSPIVASGSSGSGNPTAVLQVQGGANVLIRDIEGNGDNSIGIQQGIEYYIDTPPMLLIISDGRSPTFVQFDSFEALTYSVNNDTVGGIINDHGVPRLAIENDAQLSTIPSAVSSLSDFLYLPNEIYSAIEAVTENVVNWRGHLVSRLKQYAIRINDIQMTNSNAIASGDINAQSFSSVSARLDHYAERINQQDQVINENSIALQSLVCSLDQFKVSSEAQFLSPDNQIKSVIDSSTCEMIPQQQTVPHVGLGLEQGEVVEGLRGKIEELEQQIQNEGYAVEGLREMVVGLRENMNSSLGTIVTSQSNTSGSVPVGRIKLARDHDVIRKGIE